MGLFAVPIIALRNEKGSYNLPDHINEARSIIALRNEKGSYNLWQRINRDQLYYSTAK